MVKLLIQLMTKGGGSLEQKSLLVTITDKEICKYEILSLHLVADITVARVSLPLKRRADKNWSFAIPSLSS